MKLLLGFILILVGCTKTKQPLLQLEMYSDTQTALYVVQQNGKIEFGGGTNALAGKTTWKGSLTSRQLSKLQNLLRDKQIQSVKEKLTNRYVIEVKQGDEFQKFVIPLTDSSATVGMTTGAVMI